VCSACLFVESSTAVRQRHVEDSTDTHALHTRRDGVIRSKQCIKTLKVVFNFIPFEISFIQIGATKKKITLIYLSYNICNDLTSEFNQNNILSASSNVIKPDGSQHTSVIIP
jgi:hypothetical protein